MKRILNIPYLVYGLFAAACGVAVAVLGEKFILGNEDARSVIVSVFSILAGFLIAVMSLLGDQSVLPGSWRMAKVDKEAIRAKLVRQKALFYCFLLTLVLVFISTLTDNHYPETTKWVERIYFGFATTAFLLAFRLPAQLMDVQMTRVDAVVGARQQQRSRLDKS